VNSAILLLKEVKFWRLLLDGALSHLPSMTDLEQCWIYEYRRKLLNSCQTFDSNLAPVANPNMTIRRIQAAVPRRIEEDRIIFRGVEAVNNAACRHGDEVGLSFREISAR
jgi:hypothetical protein